MKSSVLIGRVASSAFALSSFAFGQQLVEQSGVLFTPQGGSASYNECVLSFDADGDGDIDLLFPAGDGLNGAGGPAIPSYLRNNGVVSGNPSFSFESTTKMPPLNLICKEAVAIDIERDGDLDLFLPQAFDRPPKLYRNSGTPA